MVSFVCWHLIPTVTKGQRSHREVCGYEGLWHVLVGHVVALEVFGMWVNTYMQVYMDDMPLHWSP